MMMIFNLILDDGQSYDLVTLLDETEENTHAGNLNKIWIIA